MKPEKIYGGVRVSAHLLQGMDYEIGQLKKRVEELKRAADGVRAVYYEGRQQDMMEAMDALDEVLKTEGLGPKGLGGYEGKK